MLVKPKHIWRSGILTWEDADVLHISVVFTWHLPLAKKYADSLRHRRRLMQWFYQHKKAVA